MNRRKTSGDNRRSTVEAAIGRSKRVIGDALRSREDARREGEVKIAVNSTAGWNSEVQSACASLDIHRTGQSPLTSIHATEPLGGRRRSVLKPASNFLRTGSCAGMRPGACALTSQYFEPNL
jgi:hypothetical protein